MKNRRIALIAFMLVAVLTMGIGFAAYSTTLSVSGTTAVSQDAVDFTHSVKFVSAVSDREAFGKATVAADGMSAGFEVSGMSKTGDVVAFTYTIQNTSQYDVSVVLTTTPTAAKTDPNFTVTAAPGSLTVSAGGSATVTVSVALHNDISAFVAPIAWTIKYTATSVEP